MSDENDMLGGDFNVKEEIPFSETRLYKILCLVIQTGAQALIAYTIATGLWYLTVASNGLAQYSSVAETGKDMIAVGILVLLFLFTGENNG